MRTAALVAALIVAACGTASASSSPGAHESIRLLTASAVPDIPYTTAVLTVAELARDADIAGLASKFASWGYVEGAERTFQGESRHLTFVVSRSLVFRDAAGADAYVSFVHSHATAFFGIAGVQALLAQGRPGWVFTPAACACHLANPVLVGVVSEGPAVAWLEINGPEATHALLVALLDPSNSAPTN